MIGFALQTLDISLLRHTFGARLREQAPLARYTAARLGGQADALLEVDTTQALADAVSLSWEHAWPYLILGGGSNVLVSDTGVRGLVIVNRARRVRFNSAGDAPTVWAESGANFGLLARQAAQRGLAGLEWAAGIPGTLGGAVIGNAGAHGADMAGNLLLAEILQHDRLALGSASQLQEWPVENFEYAYRSSNIKRQALEHSGRPLPVVLSATLGLERSTPDQVQARIDEFVAYRHLTQPPGASMGSMFKNPPGDYAGRLIEAVGLKGVRVGDAQISPLHANFFINLGNARSSDILALIEMAREQVEDVFDVHLELEIELVGDW
jgi:UDP-N-acetylmuramate dehydrogenase